MQIKGNNKGKTKMNEIENKDSVESINKTKVRSQKIIKITFFMRQAEQKP